MAFKLVFHVISQFLSHVLKIFPLRSLLVALSAAAFSLFFFSPRLLVYTEPIPGTFEWTRGLNFLSQLEGLPMNMVEPALRHRLLPVIIAKAFHLKGYAAFTIGWAGVLGLLAYVYHRTRSFGVPERISISAVFLMASTSAVITSFGWLGIFDCWWVLALLVIALDPLLWNMAFAALLAPWVDERFLIGLPAAFAARWLVISFRRQDACRGACVILFCILPYIAWRFYSFLYLPEDSSSSFLTADFLIWLSMAPHGWWMAYRLAWLFLILSIALPNSSQVKPATIVAVVLLTGLAAIITAADISRSAMVIAPYLITGLILSWRAFPLPAERWVPWLAASNFLVPFVHVVYNKLQAVHPLPWEIIRLAKKLL